jgi:hypothetical protein
MPRSLLRLRVTEELTPPEGCSHAWMANQGRAGQRLESCRHRGKGASRATSGGGRTVRVTKKTRYDEISGRRRSRAGRSQVVHVRRNLVRRPYRVTPRNKAFTPVGKRSPEVDVCLPDPGAVARRQDRENRSRFAPAIGVSGRVASPVLNRWQQGAVGLGSKLFSPEPCAVRCTLAIAMRLLAVAKRSCPDVVPEIRAAIERDRATEAT